MNSSLQVAIHILQTSWTGPNSFILSTATIQTFQNTEKIDLAEIQ
jgi:hypothetical protein